MFKLVNRILNVIKNPPAPNWHIEKLAKPCIEYPYAGFWKRKLWHKHGLAIGPEGNGLYYVSFCGPGGCFDKGQYRDNTKIINDPNYKIIDENTIEVKMKKGFKKYIRVNSREVN